MTNKFDRQVHPARAPRDVSNAFHQLRTIVELAQGSPVLSELLSPALLEWARDCNRHRLSWDIIAALERANEQDNYRYLRHRADSEALQHATEAVSNTTRALEAIMLQVSEAAKHLEAASTGLLTLAEELSKMTADRTDSQ